MSDVRDELGRLVAYVFNTLGGRRITEVDWVRVLSLERQWVPPSRARRLAQIARNAGLLRDAGDDAFERGLESEAIELPLDYRPNLEAMEAAGLGSGSTPATLPLFRRIVRRVAEKLAVTEPEIVGRVNALQNSFGGLLTAEVAALQYAALQGVDVAPFLDEVAQGLRAPRST